jgi:hypothetical protein
MISSSWTALPTSHTGWAKTQENSFPVWKKLFNMIKENYASYCVKPDMLAQQEGGGYSEDALTTAINEVVNYYNKFLLTQVFWAAAPESVRRLLSHKDQTLLTVDDAYQVFFTEHGVESDKNSQPSTPFQMNQNPSSRTRMWLLSGHNNYYKHEICNKDSTIVEINPEAKVSPEAISATNLQGKDQMQLETVNCVSTVKKESKKISPASMRKVFNWPKIKSTTEDNSAQISNNDPNNGGVGSDFLS